MSSTNKYEKVQCKKCPKLISKSNLAKHTVLCKGKKKFQCESCTSSFSYKPGLLNHIRLKHPEKQHLTHDQQPTSSAIICSQAQSPTSASASETSPRLQKESIDFSINNLNKAIDIGLGGIKKNILKIKNKLCFVVATDVFLEQINVVHKILLKAENEYPFALLIPGTILSKLNDNLNAAPTTSTVRKNTRSIIEFLARTVSSDFKDYTAIQSRAEGKDILYPYRRRNTPESFGILNCAEQIRTWAANPNVIIVTEDRLLAIDCTQQMLPFVNTTDFMRCWENAQKSNRVQDFLTER